MTAEVLMATPCTKSLDDDDVYLMIDEDVERDVGLY